MKLRSCHVLAAGLLVALHPPALAAGPDRWIEARSAHFIVISNAHGEQARETALQFERVRTMFAQSLGETLGGNQLNPRKPVVILAVDNEGSMREVLPQFWDRKGQRPAGAYVEGPHHHYIALRVDAPDRERFRRALHEYVHVVMHASMPKLPAWLDEGLPELWSTLVADDRSIEIGHPARHHLRTLRARRTWIPLDELLAMDCTPAARDRHRLALFYAQSWALAHYVMLGGAQPALALAPSSYVEHLRQGADAIAAAGLAFGDLSALTERLAAYVRTGRFGILRVEIPQLASAAATEDQDSGVHVRTLSPAESLAIRAAFLVDAERPGVARRLLAAALRLDPNQPLVLETLGRLDFQENRPWEAAAWFDRAIESGAASHLAFFYRAIVAGPVSSRTKIQLPSSPVRGFSGVGTSDTIGEAADVRLRLDAAETGGAAKTDEAALAQAKDLLRRAIDLNPEFAPAYARLAGVYARDDEGLEAALRLMRRATELEPENAGYWVELGTLLVRLDRPNEAREAGERGLTHTRSAGSRRLLERFLLTLDSL